MQTIGIDGERLTGAIQTSEALPFTQIHRGQLIDVIQHFEPRSVELARRTIQSVRTIRRRYEEMSRLVDAHTVTQLLDKTFALLDADEPHISHKEINAGIRDFMPFNPPERSFHFTHRQAQIVGCTAILGGIEAAAASLELSNKTVRNTLRNTYQKISRHYDIYGSSALPRAYLILRGSDYLPQNEQP